MHLLNTLEPNRKTKGLLSSTLGEIGKPDVLIVNC